MYNWVVPFGGFYGTLAEWLRRALQKLVHRFESGRCLHWNLHNRCTFAFCSCIIEAMSRRKWTDDQLKQAVVTSRSRRQVLIKLGLQPKGGNYAVVKWHMIRLKLDASHFLGQGWNQGGTNPWAKSIPLDEVLVQESSYQSYSLKLRLYKAGLKQPYCELCRWAKAAPDGRIPLELDHINGDPADNRLHNLRVLCPNCHSLQPTHRARNKNRIKLV